MQRIVINRCFGGFGLSDEAMQHYLKLKGIPYETSPPSWCQDSQDYWHAGHVGDYDYYIGDRDFDRNDPALIQTIEALGDKASGRFADLKIIEIPDGVDWQLEEYDGTEWIAEKHRTWR